MTQLPPPGDPDTLYVVDISGYIFRAYHALPPLSSKHGEPTHASLGVTSMLLKLIGDQQPGMLAVAMDSRTRSFRKEMYEDYKANRPPAPEDLKVQMGRVREIVEAYGIPVLQRDGFEADDVIATTVRMAREQGMRVVVVSADKDLLQLVDDDVVMFDTGRKVVFGEPETIKKLGVPPSQVRDYLALVGDSSDNVPGVPSVGPKTAVKLLQEHGSLEGVYANLEAVTRKGLHDKLTANRDLALLSQELVTLRSDLEVEVDRAALALGGQDVPKLRSLFEELGFTRLLAALGPAGGRAGEGASPGGPDDATGAATATAVPSPQLEGPVTLVTDGAQLATVAAAITEAGAFAAYWLTDGPRALREPIVGLALSYGEDCAYVPLGHRYLGCPTQLDEKTLAKVLGPVLSDPAVAMRCDDSKRALQAAEQFGLELAGIDCDVMLASYLIDPEAHGHTPAEICRAAFGVELESQDILQPKRRGKKFVPPSTLEVDTVATHAGAMARATAAAATHVQPQLEAGKAGELLRDLEMPLARVLARMETTGIRLDVPHLAQMSQRVAEDLVALEARCVELAGHDFNVGSPRQLETILFDELGLPVIKRTKTARSTDHDVLDELAAQHELPAAILEHRVLAKLKNTYLDALPREVHPADGRIHTDFRQAVAATGRLSSSDPNLQNIPIRTDVGRRIRDAFIPRDGYRIMAMDYSQIELRVLAHLSGDPALVEAFTGGLDVHRQTARALFGVEDEGVTREMRGQAKTVNFAVIYGQTQFALARNLRIERSEASRYIKAFFERYAGVKAYLDGVVEAARASGSVQTLCGRERHLPDLNAGHRVPRQAAERVARNTPIQGTAADIMKLAMLAVQRAMDGAGLDSRMLLTVHDELVFEAPAAEEKALEAMAREAMESVVELSVPLLVDCGWGDTWGAAH